MLTMPIIDRPRGGRRDNRRNLLTPMGERWNGVTGDFIVDLAALVAWMAVDTSLRWMPHPGRTPGKLATYCDHYATDFLDQLFGAPPIPGWTWWLDGVEDDGVDPVIGKTVREFGAKSLHAWLPEFGAEFGWQAEKDESGLRNVLNATPTVGLITTPRHVAIALPDACGPLLGVSDGPVILTSQAGSRNVRAWRQNDWFRRNAAVQFHSFLPLPPVPENSDDADPDRDHDAL